MAFNTLPHKPELKKITAAEFTRPSDTTQYTAGDVVGPVTTPAVQTLANVGKYGKGSGVIKRIQLSKSTTTVTLATFRVWFYTIAPTAIADNSAWTTLYANRESLIGYRDLDIMVSGGSGAAGQMSATALDLPYVCEAGAAIYAVISAVGAYTPASAETFSLSVTVERY